MLQLQRARAPAGWESASVSAEWLCCYSDVQIGRLRVWRLSPQAFSPSAVSRSWSWKFRGWSRWLPTGSCTAPWRWREGRSCRRTRPKPPDLSEFRFPAFPVHLSAARLPLHILFVLIKLCGLSQKAKKVFSFWFALRLLSSGDVQPWGFHCKKITRAADFTDYSSCTLDAGC